MANIIPLAGIGSRFSGAGYALPKPLIPVSGVPMIVKAVRDMPPSDKWIFLVRKEHVEKYAIDRLLKSAVRNATVHPVERTTEGQACTCALAEEYVKPDEPVFVGACDSGCLYDRKKYKKLLSDKSVSSVVFTFTKQEALRRNPAAWGWVVPGEDGRTVKGMSVKIPVSSKPFNDHAVTAAFHFQRASDFFDGIRLMVRENHRIRNEFYVDAMPIFLSKMGKRTAFFDVDYYFSWGTPADLYEYQMMEYCVRSKVPRIEISNASAGNIKKWKKYFAKKN